MEATLNLSDWTLVNYWSTPLNRPGLDYVAQISVWGKVHSQSIENNTSVIDFKYAKRVYSPTNAAYVELPSYYNYTSYYHEITCTGHRASATFAFGYADANNEGAWDEDEGWTWIDVPNSGDLYWSDVAHNANGTCSITYTATGARPSSESYEESGTIILPAFNRTITYRPNGGSGSMSNGIKNYGIAYSIAENRFTPPTNYKFNGWNTKANGSGTSYTVGQSYTTNAALELFAQWTLIGPSIILDNNTYFKTSHNSSSGLKFLSSEVKWLSGGTNGQGMHFETGSSAYQIGPATYTPNTYNNSLRGAPYYNPEEISLLGYYTKDSFNDPGIKLYELTDLMTNTSRLYVLKSVADGTYFNSNTDTLSLTNSDIDWYNEIYSINGYENTTIDTIPVNLPIAGTKQSSISNVPQWKLTESNTITLYALWNKPNLTFTYDANGGTAPNNNQNIQVIADPQTTKTLHVKTLAESGIIPPTGYKFIHWNVKNDNSEFSLGETSTIPLGGYLLDTTLYAIYEQYQHRVVLHANSYSDGDNGPAFFPQLDGAKTTVTGDGHGQLYLGGSSNASINYRGQPIHPDELKFLGYYTVDGIEVYRVNKNLQHECIYNEVTYILNPAKAVGGDYFKDLVNDIGLPSLNGTDYTQIDSSKTSDLQGYKWAYTGSELEDVHLYAKWGSKSNIYFASNGTYPENADGYIWFKNNNSDVFDAEGIAEFLEE